MPDWVVNTEVGSAETNKQCHSDILAAIDVQKCALGTFTGILMIT